MIGTTRAVLEAVQPATKQAAGPRVDFIGIGVQKAATSWLFRCLAEHPQVRTAHVTEGSAKELHFFNHDYERGYTWYHRGFEFGTWKTLEFSTLYFHDRNVPRRIHRYNRDARLLLALRSPVERAVSQHRHEIRRGRVSGALLPLRAAAQQNPSYIEQGLYGEHLEWWLDYFDLESIHIVEYEDVRSSPGDVLAAAYAFMDVDEAFVPGSIHERINVALVPRSVRLDRALRWASRTSRALLGDRIVSMVGRAGASTWIRRRNRVELDDRRVPPITPDDRAWLAESFVQDIERLGRILGRDFSHWL